MDEIVARLRPKGKIRRSPRSIWPKYCQTIISAARFLSQFPKSDEFYQWVEFFDQDDRARPALPMILSNEIQGIGFALACDFLKELGYTSFPKPDVHIKDIFTQLDLVGSREDYQVFKAVVKSRAILVFHPMPPISCFG